MIIADEVTSLTQHMRRITFEDGPIIPARKSRGRVEFQVTHLALRWFEGQEPGAVIAHGVYYHAARQVMVHVERSFDLDGKRTPRWVKEAVHGTAK